MRFNIVLVSLVVVFSRALSVSGARPESDVLSVALLRREHKTPTINYSDQKSLRLCDCEVATGTPGLSCSKEGFFVSGFLREGQWLAGGGLVPLSLALCCRPCLPDSPPEAAIQESNSTALAIISIGCRQSQASGAAQLQCEGPGDLVAGYVQSMRVNPQTAAYYPLGAAECCTPGVLLSNGDAWELEQCNCQVADGVSCGGLSSGQLLAGFENWRMTLDARYVPIAPAKCCSLCLGEQVHKMSTCDIHNGCSGHGVCITGQCECLSGYMGSDCSKRPSHIAGGLPVWLMIFLGIAMVVAVTMIVWVVTRLVRLVGADSESGSDVGSDMEEPLLSALRDEVGSVGSTDTEDDTDSETGSHIDQVVRATDAASDAQQRTADVLDTDRMRAVEDIIAAALRQHPHDREAGIASALGGMREVISLSEDRNTDAVEEVMQAVAGPLTDAMLASYRSLAAQEARQGSGEESSAGRDHPLEASGGAAYHHSQRHRRPHQRPTERNPPEHQNSAPPDRVSQEGRSEDQSGLVAIDIEEAPAPCGDGHSVRLQRLNKKAALQAADKVQAMASGPLATLNCSVCLTRFVQVALIPCGHACMCRRCSRRLSRCPICRRDILRRQRLFVGG